MWDLTKETMHLPPSCLQGGVAGDEWASLTRFSSRLTDITWKILVIDELGAMNFTTQNDIC